MHRESNVSKAEWIAAAEANPGCTMGELAEIVGSTKRAAVVANSRYKLGLKRRTVGHPLAARRNLVVDYAERGYSSEEIADLIGCTEAEARSDRSNLRRLGKLVSPSWETLFARGWDANMARKLRGAKAGDADAWAKANGVKWPKKERKVAAPKQVADPFPKPSFAGDGPLIRWRVYDGSMAETPHPWKVYAEAENRAMRARCGL